MGILVMTQTRSSIVALILIIGLFFMFNIRPRQIKDAVRGLMRPASLVLIAIVFSGHFVFYATKRRSHRHSIRICGRLH
jgi:branched-subunit amino acid permease